MRHGKVRMSDLILPVSNWNPSTSATEDFVYVDISSVDSNLKRIVGPKTIPCLSAPSRARQLLNPADVLVSTVRPNLNCVACVPGELEGAIASTGFCVLRPNQQALDSRYLFHWVQSKAFIRDMVSKATGASYPAVTDSIIHASELPLPPLEEQRRIAAILDQSKDISLKSRLSNELASSLIEYEMIQRFGRPGGNQARSDCLSLVDAGVSVIDCPHSTPKWTEEGKVCLRTSNLGKGDWIWQDTRRISDHDFQERSRRAPLEPGDIVLSREGTVGIAAIVTYGMEVCMGQRLVQLKLDASCLMPEYLLAQLLYLLKPDRISHAMTGSTSKHINVKDLRELKIYCPPLEEQREFEAFCRSAKMLRAKCVALGEKSELLERSIQAASFQ